MAATASRRPQRRRSCVLVALANAFLAFGLVVDDASSQVTVLADRDTYVDSSQTAGTFGFDPIMRTGEGANGTSYWSFVHFDLASLPRCARVRSVRLDVPMVSIAPAQLEFHAIEQNWSQASVTWRNRPQVNARALWTTTVPPTLTPPTLVVDSGAVPALRAEVERWITDPSSNHGLALLLPPGQLLEFSTRESATGPARLTVDFVQDGSLTTSPATLPFDWAPPTTPPTRELTVRNPNPWPLAVTTTVTGPDANLVSVAPSAPTTIPANGTTTLRVAVTLPPNLPYRLGYQATVTMTNTCGQTLALVPVTMNFRAPRYVFSKTPRGAIEVYVGEALTVDYNVRPDLAARWSVARGALPGGLSLDATTGVLAGTPTTAGSLDLDLGILDQHGGTATVPSGVVVYDALELHTSALLGAGTGHPYRATLDASGGKPGRRWTVDGLPAGLATEPDGGDLAIVGTPRDVGTYDLTVRVADGNGRAVERTLELAVYPGLTLVADVRSVVAEEGEPIPPVPFSAAGGVPPFTWRAMQLPPGITGRAARGAGDEFTLEGAPARPGSGTRATVVVEDAIGARRAVVVTFDVAERLRWQTDPSLTAPGGGWFRGGTTYRVELEARGGVPPFTALASNTPPNTQLRWDTTPDRPVLVLEGTPVGDGTFPMRLTLEDAFGVTAEQLFDFPVLPDDKIVQWRTTTALEGGMFAETRRVVSLAPALRNDRAHEVAIERLSVFIGGAASPAADLARIAVYHDVDGDGRLDAREPRVGGSDGPFVDGAYQRVPLAPAMAVPAGTDVHFVVELQVRSRAPIGTELGAAIGRADGLRVVRTSNGVAQPVVHGGFQQGAVAWVGRRAAFPADVDGDRRVTVADVQLLARAARGTPVAGAELPDVDGDGTTGRRDADLTLGHLLGDAVVTRIAPTTTAGALLVLDGFDLPIEDRSLEVALDGEVLPFHFRWDRQLVVAVPADARQGEKRLVVRTSTRRLAARTIHVVDARGGAR